MQESKPKVRIVSPGGYGQDTEIWVDSQQLSNVISAKWEVAARGEKAQVTLVLRDVQVDVEGELARPVCMQSIVGFLIIYDPNLQNDKPRVVYCGDGGWSCARSYEGTKKEKHPITENGEIAGLPGAAGALRAIKRDFNTAGIPLLPDGYHHAYCNNKAMQWIARDINCNKLAIDSDKLEKPGEPVEPSPDPRNDFYPINAT